MFEHPNLLQTLVEHSNRAVLAPNDNSIYCYRLPSFSKKTRPLNKHSSYITHIDFSEDGQYLHSTCGAYELLFWDLQKGKQVTSGATQLRDEKWQTWTTPIGWPVQGIYKKGYDGTDINAVDRSNLPISGQKPYDYHLIATGDDYSKLNVYKYPCICPNSKSVTGQGHSSHVTNVKFSKDDQKIITTGGEDQGVFQWNVQKKSCVTQMRQVIPNDKKKEPSEKSKYF